MRSPVIELPRGAAHDPRLARVVEASRRLAQRRGGRAWINGREVGGPDPRFAHLARSYD